MVLSSKKGSALLQVLLVTAVLAGIATMLLRASLSRTSTVRQVKRAMSTEMLVESCMAEVNSLWAAKTSDAFARDMGQCIMYCDDTNVGANSVCTTGEGGKAHYTHSCSSSVNNTDYTVTATISGNNGNCQITYQVASAGNL